MLKPERQLLLMFMWLSFVAVPFNYTFSGIRCTNMQYLNVIFVCVSVKWPLNATLQTKQIYQSNIMVTVIMVDI